MVTYCTCIVYMKHAYLGLAELNSLLHAVLETFDQVFMDSLSIHKLHYLEITLVSNMNTETEYGRPITTSSHYITHTQSLNGYDNTATDLEFI